MRYIVKLNDPHHTYTVGDVDISGTKEVEVLATPQIVRAIQVGVLVKVSDVAENVSANLPDKQDKQKSKPAEKDNKAADSEKAAADKI